MMKDPKIFVSGPYTSVDQVTQDLYVMRADRIGRFIAMQGLKVYVPHNATAYWDDANSYEYFQDLHMSFLKDWATDLYLLPDWEKSKGAILECQVALRQNKKIWETKELEDMILEYRDNIKYDGMLFDG